MKKQIPMLLGLLVLLLGLWLLLGRRETERQRRDIPERATQVDSLAVNRLVMMRPNEPTLVFEKDVGGFWLMVEPLEDRTNPNLVLQIERGLSQMKLIDRISSRDDQHAAFMVDAASGVRLQAYADDELQADLYVGRVTPDGELVYVRREGSSEVYSGTGGAALAALRNRRLEDFRNRNIFAYDPSVYDSLQVTSTGAPQYALARVDSMSWKVRLGKGAFEEADANRATGLLRALGHMTASGFAPDSLELSWDQPDLRLKAWRLGGSMDELELLTVEGENYCWVRVLGGRYVFKVFESTYKTFIQDPAQLKAGAPPAS